MKIYNILFLNYCFFVIQILMGNQEKIMFGGEGRGGGWIIDLRRRLEFYLNIINYTFT